MRVTRWLMLALGLAIAAGALALLLLGDGTEEGRGPPLGEIDDESRARLERVLREADQEGAEP